MFVLWLVVVVCLSSSLVCFVCCSAVFLYVCVWCVCFVCGVLCCWLLCHWFVVRVCVVVVSSSCLRSCYGLNDFPVCDCSLYAPSFVLCFFIFV